jgi:TonB-dependent starch-binding outer membrane protein SusC
MLYSAQLLVQRTVTGKVTDEKGNPLPNVSVVVKGTTTGQHPRLMALLFMGPVFLNPLNQYPKHDKLILNPNNISPN